MNPAQQHCQKQQKQSLCIKYYCFYSAENVQYTSETSCLAAVREVSDRVKDLISDWRDDEMSLFTINSTFVSSFQIFVYTDFPQQNVGKV